MGYIPPHVNETALKYGERMLEKGPAIERVERIQQSVIQRMNRGGKNPYKREEETALMKKRRKIEQRLYGKGRQFDAWT
ncbi:hypothetical protein [Alteribacillus iranensis]|uniref:Uncharacterized protein n=1 Tax=Alteribacillus iranensis TaxID=930128 RepID=A0A1I2D1Z8_9BACI|nr:hypothetical protein [Alteribacillus iranensis]SFE74529.1 hypothetical protein SAMN05192532_103349 [Alteribacillus iranensis]